MSNTFGDIFKLTTFGESHGEAIGGIITGFPPNVFIDTNFIQIELDKRKPGTKRIYTQRQEADRIEILSGIFDGHSTGTPISFIIRNLGSNSQDYEHLKNLYRPGHADYTYQTKYQIRDYRGGGRASARETANWVVGGAFAKLLIKKYNINIFTYTSQIGKKKLDKPQSQLDIEHIYRYSTRCPDTEWNTTFEQIILDAKKDNNSVGGVVSCVVKNCPTGLGEPVFDKFEAKLAYAMLSINASKGFEIGRGFEAAELKGSENNDFMAFENNKTVFKTNNAGGTLGGITSGQDIFFRVAFKPTPSIAKEQQTIDNQNTNTQLSTKGRHDACVVPRAVAVVEAMTAMVIADFILKQNKNI